MDGAKAVKAGDYSEVDAMGEVDKALGRLDVEAQVRVLEWASSKYKIQREPRNLEHSTLAAHEPLEPSSGATVRPRSIKDFLAQKRPGSSYERVACLVYFLEKFGDRAEVESKDIVQANADARLQRMSNPAVFIKHATHTYGYLTSLGQRRFALSARGEAIVEALPDRAKLEEAQAKFSFGRKTKKRTRRQK